MEAATPGGRMGKVMGNLGIIPTWKSKRKGQPCHKKLPAERRAWSPGRKTSVSEDSEQECEA